MLALCYFDLFQGLICQDEQFNEITQLVTILQITNYKLQFFKYFFVEYLFPTLIMLILLLNSFKIH
jgi:hypothetical protein